MPAKETLAIALAMAKASAGVGAGIDIRQRRPFAIVDAVAAGHRLDVPGWQKTLAARLWSAPRPLLSTSPPTSTIYDRSEWGMIL
jgi:hypothetical protein